MPVKAAVIPCTRANSKRIAGRYLTKGCLCPFCHKPTKAYGEPCSEVCANKKVALEARLQGKSAVRPTDTPEGLEVARIATEREGGPF